MLSNKELSALINLLSWASEKKPDNVEFKSMLDKFNSLTDLKVPEIPNYNTDDLDLCLDNLSKLTSEYSKLDGGSPMELYDNIKTAMTSQLEYLATHKDRFIDKANYFEDVLKDQLKVQLMYIIVNEQGISINQAEKVVKGDMRYVEYRDKVQELKEYASILKSAYNVYDKIWAGLLQSVSTSKQERNHSNFQN